LSVTVAGGGSAGRALEVAAPPNSSSWVASAAVAATCTKMATSTDSRIIALPQRSQRPPVPPSITCFPSGRNRPDRRMPGAMRPPATNPGALAREPRHCGHCRIPITFERSSLALAINPCPRAEPSRAMNPRRGDRTLLLHAYCASRWLTAKGAVGPGQPLPGFEPRRSPQDPIPNRRGSSARAHQPVPSAHRPLRFSPPPWWPPCQFVVHCSASASWLSTRLIATIVGASNDRRWAASW